MLTNVLLIASLALPAIATAPSYFTFNDVAVEVPQSSVCGAASISINIEDPATGNTTTCSQNWAQQGTNIFAPADWVSIPSSAYKPKYLPRQDGV